MKINPRITQRFIKEIRQQSDIRHVEFNIGGRVVMIDVFRNVFPPQASSSVSSRCLFEELGDLIGKLVADIGCGTGIESIMAILSGATHVDASDISANACSCAEHNIELNGLKNKINVYKGDLFSGLPKCKYDLIIANLPIVDFQPVIKDDVTNALYDPGWILHERLFVEGKRYLKEKGEILFTHANLQSAEEADVANDFRKMELLIANNGYRIAKKSERYDLGYQWNTYLIIMI